ncbi:MAG TPA: hypothetical protein VK363_19255 [Pyrinomonadaceae bacterium]|nr:hypothetical protein [Pyrinomonadaceae bacterium]
MEAERIEALKAFADKPCLPPESAQTLRWIEGQIADVLALDAADPFALMMLPFRVTREKILEACLIDETRKAAKALAAHVNLPFLDGQQLIFEMN